MVSAADRFGKPSRVVASLEEIDPAVLEELALFLEQRGIHSSGVSNLAVAARNATMNLIGNGTPEAAVTAPVGTVFHRLDGGAGTSFYVKESGTGNVGWVGK